MDISIIIIGIIAISLCALPFIYSENARKRSNKLLFNQLINLIELNNCQLGSFDVLSNFAIGIDNKNDNFYFISSSNETKIAEVIDLTNLKSVDWQKVDKFNASNTASTIDKLQLKFVFKDGSSTKLFNFFDQNDGLMLSDQFIILKKWQKILADLLK